MSKLAQKLQLDQGRLRKAVDRPMGLTSVDAQWRNPSSYEANEYTLGCRFSVRAWLTKQEASGGAEAVVVREARRHIIEEVFGEFRAPLMDVERALWERDFDAASDAIRRVRAQMFED